MAAISVFFKFRTEQSPIKVFVLCYAVDSRSVAFVLINFNSFFIILINYKVVDTMKLYTICGRRTLTSHTRARGVAHLSW